MAWSDNFLSLEIWALLEAEKRLEPQADENDIAQAVYYMYRARTFLELAMFKRYGNECVKEWADDVERRERLEIGRLQGGERTVK